MHISATVPLAQSGVSWSPLRFFSRRPAEFGVSLGAGTQPHCAYQRSPARLFFRPFFDLLLGPSFFRFWCQLGPNLPPNLAPKSTQNRAKRSPNPEPNSIIFSIPFFIDFGSLLGRILVSFGFQVECQVDQQIDHMASCWQVGRQSTNTKNL